MATMMVLANTPMGHGMKNSIASPINMKTESDRHGVGMTDAIGNGRGNDADDQADGRVRGEDPLRTAQTRQRRSTRA